MKKVVAAIAVLLGLLSLPAMAQTVALNTLTLAGGATYSNNVITFGAFGATATTTTLSGLLTVGQDYTINITGTDGPGNRMFSAAYPNQPNTTLNFGDPSTLPFFVATAEVGGELKLTLNGNGALQGPNQITGITIQAVATPGPMAGAGIPALLAIGGMMWARRRKAV